MNALSIHSASVQESQKPSSFNWKVAAKALVVASLVSALAVAFFFGGEALLALISAGAASWKIGLLSVAVLSTAASLIGAGFFAKQHNMFEETTDNIGDAAHFARDTLAAGLYTLVWGATFVKEWEIWNLIMSR